MLDNPTFASQYCDGSRQPPEFGSSGWSVPPGIADATVPNPVFNLTPVATVDVGNNWINLRWGLLSLLNPVSNTTLGTYGPTTPERLRRTSSATTARTVSSTQVRLSTSIPGQRQFSVLRVARPASATSLWALPVRRKP